MSVVTPNHWHSLAAIWACQAGKDVCVEKPISHCIWEGRKVVEAARKYGRMVQADLDYRSRTALDEAYGFVQSGQIGKVVYARAWDFKRRESIGKLTGPGKIPEKVDYDLWVGPAPMLPLCARSCITIGTGSGQPATPRSATTGRTNWIRCAGRWATRGCREA